MATRFEKGFNGTLFDCIDKAIVSILGKDAVITFYYAIQQRFNFSEKEFAQRPLQMLEDLKAILGEAGYGVLEKAIRSQIEETFNLRESKPLDFASLVELARQNYLQSSF